MNMNRTQTIVAVLVVGAVLFSALKYAVQTQDQVEDTDATFTITTSFYPLYFFTTQIVGDHATVYNITPAGAEPHDYEPTSRDIANIEDSDLLILHGGYFEAWGDDETEVLRGTQTGVVTVANDLATQQVNEEGENIQDPHVWLDPVTAKTEVQRIMEAVIVADPTHAEVYRANAATLQQQLDALDITFTNGLAQCATRDIITAHAAFGYMASRYNLRQVAIAGISPDEEPSAATLAEVADFAQANNVHTIFFESLVSPKFAETIANEVGAQTLVLNPLEGLTNDELANGSTYLTVMQENLNHLRTALACQ